MASGSERRRSVSRSSLVLLFGILIASCRRGPGDSPALPAYLGVMLVVLLQHLDDQLPQSHHVLQPFLRRRLGVH